MFYRPTRTPESRFEFLSLFSLCQWNSCAVDECRIQFVISPSLNKEFKELLDVLILVYFLRLMVL